VGRVAEIEIVVPAFAGDKVRTSRDRQRFQTFGRRVSPTFRRNDGGNGGFQIYGYDSRQNPESRFQYEFAAISTRDLPRDGEVEFGWSVFTARHCDFRHAQDAGSNVEGKAVTGDADAGDVHPGTSFEHQRLCSSVHGQSSAGGNAQCGLSRMKQAEYADANVLCDSRGIG
jgi:hypothetical protein